VKRTNKSKGSELLKLTAFQLSTLSVGKIAKLTRRQRQCQTLVIIILNRYSLSLPQ